MRKHTGPLFYVGLLLFVFLVMFPFLWILLAALKPPAELFGESAFHFIIQNPSFDNFVRVFTERPFARYLWNSTVVATLTTLYSITIASFAAYAIAWLSFRGKRLFWVSYWLCPCFRRSLPFLLFLCSCNRWA